MIAHEYSTDPQRGALACLVRSVATALAHPTAWLSGWLIVSVPALAETWAQARAADAALAHHPAAGGLLDQALDADLSRLEPAIAAGSPLSAVFVFLGYAVLAGGVLVCVGRDGGYRYTELLAEGGRLLMRNLRVLLVGIFAAWLLCWCIDAADGWAREEWLYDADPSAAWLHARWGSLDVAVEAWHYAVGGLFLALLFTAKVAMARLSVLDRSSALLAWLRALGAVLRHPLRTAIVIVGLAALWLGASHGTGKLTQWLLEGEHRLALGLAAGQLGILANQVLIVATLVAARDTALLHAPPPSHSDDFVYEDSLS